MGREKCLRRDVAVIVNHFDSRGKFSLVTLRRRRLVTLFSDNDFFSFVFYETPGEQIEAVRRNGRCVTHTQRSPTICTRIGQRSNQEENFPVLLRDASAILQIPRREASPISSRDLAFLSFSCFPNCSLFEIAIPLLILVRHCLLR